MCPTPPADSIDDDKRRRAYQAGSRLARDRIERDAPLDAAALRAVEANDIVVVPGSYDHVELVLDALGLPYRQVMPDQLRRVQLRPEQLLVVNCPGHLDAPDIVRVRDFVTAGGTLFSTDWALRNLIEPAFPGVLAYNDTPTTDAVVRIEIRDPDSPYLRGVLDAGEDPQWWLEGSSYPICILDGSLVRVLISSKELGMKWGEPSVAVVFPHGEGEVFHMISHHYLQRTELRSDRHRAGAATYWAEKGVAMSAGAAGMTADLRLGEVEAAQTSARLFANIVADKKRKQRPE